MQQPRNLLSATVFLADESSVHETEADKVDHVVDSIEVTGNLFGQSAAASQGKHVNIMHIIIMLLQ